MYGCVGKGRKEVEMLMKKMNVIRSVLVSSDTLVRHQLMEELFQNLPRKNLIFSATGSNVQDNIIVLMVQLLSGNNWYFLRNSAQKKAQTKL